MQVVEPPAGSDEADIVDHAVDACLVGEHALQRSLREGPESARKSAFRCEAEIGFTALSKRSCSYASIWWATAQRRGGRRLSQAGGSRCPNRRRWPRCAPKSGLGQKDAFARLSTKSSRPWTLPGR